MKAKLVRHNNRLVFRDTEGNLYRFSPPADITHKRSGSTLIITATHEIDAVKDRIDESDIDGLPQVSAGK